MNLQAEKLGLIEWIARLNDATVIEKIKHIHDDSKSVDWWEEIPVDEKASIEKGLKDFSEGNVHSHESAKKIYEKYL
jgi:hypothetical protein